MEDDLIQQALDKAVSKTPVRQKRKKKAKNVNPGKLWEKLFEENLKKEGYIK